MMIESFELRESLRALRRDVPPPPELWAGIDRALDQPTTRRGAAASRRVRAGRPAWLLAAGLAAMTVLAIGLVPASNRDVGAEIAAHPTQAWQPTDRRLQGAAIELAAAQMELRLALRQSPSSLALRRLLLQTRQQQSRLQEFEHQTG